MWRGLKNETLSLSPFALLRGCSFDYFSSCSLRSLQLEIISFTRIFPCTRLSFMRRDFSFDERSESKVAKSNKTSKNKKESHASYSKMARAAVTAIIQSPVSCMKQRARFIFLKYLYMMETTIYHIGEHQKE